MNYCRDNLFPEGYNSILGLLYSVTFTSGFSRAIWEGNVISNFVYLLAGSSSITLGNLTGLNGFTQLLVSPLLGWACDRYPRSLILNCTGVLGLLCTSLTILAVYLGNLFILSVAFCSWGVLWGAMSPALDALLADTVTQGSRSKAYGARQSIMNLSSSFGPALAAILFATLGDQWSLNECKVVMISGLSLFFLPCWLLWQFKTVASGSDSGNADSNNDVKSLEPPTANVSNSLYRRVILSLPPVLSAGLSYSSSKRHNDSAKPGYEQLNSTDLDIEMTSAVAGNLSPTRSQASSVAAKAKESTIDGSMVCQTESDDAPMVDASSTQQTDSAKPTNDSMDSPTPLFVPILIAGGDIITGLASGMTVKFFPIFFMDTLKMGPIAVSVLYMVTPLCTTVSTQVVQELNRRYFGRIWVTVIVKVTGVLLLILLVHLADSKFSTAFVLPVFVLRTALMNSTKSQTKSIVMDSIPKNKRGIWSSAESINAATWSGSAVLGGYLINEKGILFNFLTTALLQLLAVLPLIAISRYVPRES